MKEQKITIISKNDIFDIIVKGFYPGLYERDDIDIDMFYKSHITSYIEKDIRSLINIKDLKKFNDFMIYLGSTTGSELNIIKISNLIEVDNKTINNWLSILIETDIVYLVNTYKESSIRKKNISKGGFCFENADFLEKTLKEIENMPETTLEEIVSKYIEMNIAHPFMEGNVRSMRIWLDLILRKNLGVVIDWSKIKKYEYLTAMKKSILNKSEILNLIKGALTKDINNKEVIMKGIDYSYYYEEV